MEPNAGTRLTKIRQKEHDRTKMTFGAKMSWANLPKTGQHPQIYQRLFADENAERADAFFKLLVKTGEQTGL